MKKTILNFVFTSIIIFICNFNVFADTYIFGDTSLEPVSGEYLSLNNNGTQVIVELRKQKGLWIIGENQNFKIAEYPATLGTWSPSNKLIAYVSDKTLVITDSQGKVVKELNLGLRWVDSFVWLKNEEEILMFEGPSEFNYRLLKINIKTGKTSVILPESTERLQIKINRMNEDEIFFKNNRYPFEIPEDCSLGRYNLKTKILAADILKGFDYSVYSNYEVSADGRRLIITGYDKKKQESLLKIINLKNRTVKQIKLDVKKFYAFSFNSKGTKLGVMLPIGSKGLIKVIEAKNL